MTTSTIENQRPCGLDQVNVSFLNDTCSAVASPAPAPASTLNNPSTGDHPPQQHSSKTLPLVISPRWDSSIDFLHRFLETNNAWVNEQIIKYGAVLIRGFDIDDAVAFENAVLAVQPNLCDAYRGTSPRSVMPGTKYAFSAADVPVTYPIAQHLEMSFLKSPPRNLYFGCMKASSKPGGETSLCDFRKVFQALSPQLREKLRTKKIKYTRKHYVEGESFTYDVGAMLSWPQLFGTTSKQDVETIVKEEEAAPVKWIGPNEDTFLQEWVDEPFQVHPDTGEDVWFNHSQVFHWTTFPCELWYAFVRVGDWHLLVHFIFLSIYCVIKYGLLGYTMALNTTFGDDEPISFAEMNEVRAAIHKNMVFSRWRKGDILCIDNFSTSHGRQPTYDKGRKVVVAWSHPIDKTSSAVVAAETNTTAPVVTSSVAETDAIKHIPVNKITNDEGDDVPGLASISPDSSPESTLNSSEARSLQESLQAQFLASALAGALAKGTSMKLCDASAAKGAPHHPQRRSMKSCPDLFRAGSDFWSNNVLDAAPNTADGKTTKVE